MFNTDFVCRNPTTFGDAYNIPRVICEGSLGSAMTSIIKTETYILCVGIYHGCN